MRDTNHASKIALDFDSELPEQRFLPFAPFSSVTSAWHRNVGPSTVDDVVGWRGRVTWLGDVARWCGRVTWQGDVALTWRDRGWFPVCVAPPLRRRRFGRRGLRHSREGDVWREYDRKTTHLLDANHRQVWRGKYPPTVDLGRGQSDS